MNVIHNMAPIRMVNAAIGRYSVAMPKSETQLSQQQKSQAILNSARKHFAENGFEATKLAHVASDAGVAVGTIYLRYDGKAELLNGVLDDVDASFCDAMDTPEIWSKPFPERFQAIVSAMFATAQAEEHFAELMALSSYSDQALCHHKRRILTKIEEHVQDGVKRAELRDDADVAIVARMAHAMVEGAMREWMANPDRNLDDTIAHIVDAYERWMLVASQSPMRDMPNE